MGALVLVGDASEVHILKRARINKADHLIAVCGNDSINTEIAVIAKKLATTKDITCTVHITDPYLWRLLKEQELIEQDTQHRFRLELFNIYDSGARYLLRQTLFIDKVPEEVPHLLIVGAGALAEYLVLHAAQSWALAKWEGRIVDNEKLQISIVTSFKEKRSSRLFTQYPLVNNICKINEIALQVDSPELKSEILEANQNPITNVFICLDDTFLGLQSGFSLLEWLRGSNIQFLVQMTEDAGLVTLLKASRQLELSPIEAFGLLDKTCKISLFDDGIHENLARAIHEHYLQEEIAKGHAINSVASLHTWDTLSNELKQSNRHQADHIGNKLRAIGCGLKPWVAGGIDEFKFSGDEVEKTARLEHERWLEEKKAQGWCYAEDRDNKKKMHPDLLSWKRLSKEAKEKNIQSVQQIPILLARAGFQIYRLPSKEG